MFRQIKSFVLVAITFGVVMSCAVPALGARKPRKFFHGERYINDNEEEQRTAYCLRKIVYRWKIDEGTVKSDQFANCDVRQVGDYQIIDCSGAAGEKDGEVLYNVTDNDTAEVTFSGTALDGTAQVVCAKWYNNFDGNGKCTGFIAYARFVGSIKPEETENRAGPIVVPVDVVVENERAQEWNDEANAPVAGTEKTVYGSKIYYAEFQGNLDEDHMTEVLWTCVNAASQPPPGSRTECLNDGQCQLVDPVVYRYCGRYDEGKEPVPGGIDWYPPTGVTSFTLVPGEEERLYLGTFHKSRRILFRFYTDPDHLGRYRIDDYEVVQFWVLELIPAVSQWGLVVIALLVLAAGTIVIRRRKAMAAQA